MTYRISLLVLLGSLLCTVLTAQQLDFVPGEVLISLPHGATPYRAAEAHQFFEGKQTRLRSADRVSVPMNVWRFTFDANAIHAKRFAQALHRSPHTEMAQLNHLIEQRVVPNDPLFPSQWQYINDGTGGGLANADLDIPEAWDITTGGTTALGQEIVVAVIDDGIDPNHSDFGDNQWFNTAEIPDNGIDDDNNGFVDDYNGWDADGGDDDVYFNGSHGTPVAGIIGAQGNNGIGVAGVSWDVKLMIIQGGGNEAQALAAYSYAFVQRQRYNQTGGAQGAFVVASNASWGINFGQPANAPLWCAYYDSLGQEGILNCGATINGNVNVDIDGDLPTGCTSDYLISVTNLGIDDNKVTGAGYGALSIDLGAYGEGTYTTALGDTYGGFGGTSGATPHVTGAIGLLYAAPCPSIANLALADPAQAALLMRGYILDGVTPNTSLQGITVTGGRLNVNNSMQELITTCSAADCLPPYAITADNITTDAATLSWTTIDSVTSVDLRYRVVGATEWSLFSNLPATTTDLTGLLPCTTYEYQMRAACDTSTTSYTTAASFTTDGCCDAPGGLAATAVGDSTITLTWESVTAALHYEVRYRPDATTGWVSIVYADTSAVLVDLMACTAYELQLRTLCGSDSTEYSPSLLVNTTGCGACIDLTYCETTGEETFFEWLDEVTIGNYVNPSGNDGGYASFTNSSIDIEIGVPINYSVTPAYSFGADGEYIRIWVDMNQNGTFEPMEEVAALDNVTSLTTGTFTIPEGALTGSTRMRISMKYDNAPTPCESFGYGEVEDYCVNLMSTTVQPECNAPASVMVTDSSDTELTFTMTPYSGATATEIAHRVSGSGDDWTYSTTSLTTYTLTGLEPCTTYDVTMRSICSDDLASEMVSMMGVPTTCSISGVISLSGGMRMQAMPNPFGQSLMVELELMTPTDVELTLTGVSGAVVHRSVLAAQAGSQTVPLMLDRSVPQGMYFLSVRTAYGTQVIKVVKSQ